MNANNQLIDLLESEQQQTLNQIQELVESMQGYTTDLGRIVKIKLLVNSLESTENIIREVLDKESLIEEMEERREYEAARMQDFLESQQ